MRLFLVTNWLIGDPQVEAIYLVAAETEEESLTFAAKRAGEGLLRQQARPLRFGQDHASLVFMHARPEHIEQSLGRVPRPDHMRFDH